MKETNNKVSVSYIQGVSYNESDDEDTPIMRNPVSRQISEQLRTPIIKDSPDKFEEALNHEKEESSQAKRENILLGAITDDEKSENHKSEENEIHINIKKSETATPKKAESQLLPSINQDKPKINLDILDSSRIKESSDISYDEPRIVIPDIPESGTLE